jgi:hypothetical protein
MLAALIANGLQGEFFCVFGHPAFVYEQAAGLINRD